MVRFKALTHKTIQSISIPQSTFDENIKDIDDNESKEIDVDDRMFSREYFVNHTSETQKDDKNSNQEDDTDGRKLCAIMFPKYKAKNTNISISGYTPSYEDSPGYGLFVRLESADFSRCLLSKFEPVYFIFCLYSLDLKQKLSEDVYVDLNHKIVLKSSGIDESDQNKFARIQQMLFSLDPSKYKDVYIVIRVCKTLSNNSDMDLDDYLNSEDKAAKLRRIEEKVDNTKSKASEGDKKEIMNIRRKKDDRAIRLGLYKQFFAFGYVQVVNQNEWHCDFKEDHVWDKDVPEELTLKQLFWPGKDFDENHLFDAMKTTLNPKKKNDFKQIPVEIKLKVMHMLNSRCNEMISPQLCNIHIDNMKKKLEEEDENEKKEREEKEKGEDEKEDKKNEDSNNDYVDATPNHGHFFPTDDQYKTVHRTLNNEFVWF